MASLSNYEALLTPARQSFDASFGVRRLQSLENAAALELFLMYFCALGTHMTKPVEGWIRRAADRCGAMGFTQIGRALTHHALAEADHHVLMIADLRSLAARWNASGVTPVDADVLLGQAPSPGVLKYCQLHEENIAGDTPFAQVAIEYEIEMLPMRYGKLVVGRCIELLGPDILSCLSFITKHIMLDSAHTDFNARALDDLIALTPSNLAALAAAGSCSLDAYAGFLEDCVRLAEAHARSMQNRCIPPQCLRWRLQLPPHWNADPEHDGLPPDWLAEVRALRGNVLFDGGKRPAFKTPDGVFLDPDPIDLYAFHILAYYGEKLVGCVRLYHLDPVGPPCLTEEILGEKSLFADAPHIVRAAKQHRRNRQMDCRPRLSGNKTRFWPEHRIGGCVCRRSASSRTSFRRSARICDLRSRNQRSSRPDVDPAWHDADSWNRPCLQRNL